MARKTPLERPQRQSGSDNIGLHSEHDEAGAQAPLMSEPEGRAHESETDRDQKSYQVGYGRPPLHSRFKPGQSGNPKGRAKQSRDLKTIVRDISNEQVQIREGGRPLRVSKVEALVRQTFARAFNSDAKAFAAVIGLLRLGSEGDETTADLPAGLDFEAILADYHTRVGFVTPPSDRQVDHPTPTATSKKREG